MQARYKLWRAFLIQTTEHRAEKHFCLVMRYSGSLAFRQIMLQAQDRVVAKGVLIVSIL